MMNASASSEANKVRLIIAVCMRSALSEQTGAQTHRHHIRSPMMTSAPMPSPTQTANLRSSRRVGSEAIRATRNSSTPRRTPFVAARRIARAQVELIFVWHAPGMAADG
jgi:hypothetical protein